MLQWDEFFPEATLWNREKDFQLKYEDMNLVLEKKSTGRITSFNWDFHVHAQVKR
jgi:hypothetical protein